MRKTLNASILVLVLFCSARAGTIPSVPVAPPPPPPSVSAPTTTGIVLSLLQSVLALF